MRLKNRRLGWSLPPLAKALEGRLASGARSEDLTERNPTSPDMSRHCIHVVSRLVP